MYLGSNTDRTVMPMERVAVLVLIARPAELAAKLLIATGGSVG